MLEFLIEVDNDMIVVCNSKLVCVAEIKISSSSVIKKEEFKDSYMSAIVDFMNNEEYLRIIEVQKEYSNNDLTDGRGINKGEFAIIDGQLCNYLGFNENEHIHYFTKGKTLNSLKKCFVARMKYYSKDVAKGNR